MSDKLFNVIGGAQNYAWGKHGASSAVAQFAHNNDPSFPIDESKPYAELWMGTHPSVPTYKALVSTTETGSITKAKGETLKSIITAKPEANLGSKVIAKFGATDEIPFLFKVLSIEKVLSIQAHPDKSLGAQLRKADPAHYPDANHKPEMAIAVTDFEAFCGFKPLKQIDHLLQTIPEFRELIGEPIVKEFHDEVQPEKKDDENNKKLLQKVFGKLMRTPEDQIASYAEKLVARTKSQPELFGDVLADLIQRLDVQFPNDIGLFCGCLMLNHCNLKKGEAIFLQARDPHAYISGC
ncbi:unnamed protein product [Ambrosiozyma monospora]|uniref:Mannose-6-phosphate isomerase n=1 Tax=Ambrosiozyma monospora TaxID=43982 RepID=A0A9W6Z4R5_AMBMO|nr:unnamed protein product [Ambrosiozyma monospora]